MQGDELANSLKSCHSESRRLGTIDGKSSFVNIFEDGSQFGSAYNLGWRENQGTNLLK